MIFFFTVTRPNSIGSDPPNNCQIVKFFEPIFQETVENDFLGSIGNCDQTLTFYFVLETIRCGQMAEIAGNRFHFLDMEDNERKKKKILNL